MSYDPNDPTGIDPATRARIAVWAKENVKYWSSLEVQTQPVTEEQLENAPKPPPDIGLDVAALGAQTVAMVIEYMRTGKLGESAGGSRPVPSVQSKIITAEMISEYLDGNAVSREEAIRRQQYADARVSQIYDGTRKVMKSTVE